MRDFFKFIIIVIIKYCQFFLGITRPLKISISLFVFFSRIIISQLVIKQTWMFRKRSVEYAFRMRAKAKKISPIGVNVPVQSG